MTAEDKVIEYEIHLQDMLHSLQERLNDFQGKESDAFDLGRHLAYTEIMEIISTRHQLIWELIADDLCD